ncbi:MAG: hypothetical protein AAGC60_00450 [Acidobacteriota bacterium]
MKKVNVDLLTGQDNYAILKLPDRRFPGALIPGDSLKLLRDLSESIVRRTEGTDNQELVDEATELFHKLSERIEHYERMCRENGLSLPYPET